MTPRNHRWGVWPALLILLPGVAVAGCSIESAAREQAITQASLAAGQPGSTWVAGEDSVSASEFDGDVIACGEGSVGVGEGTVELSLELPEGYELSEFAPLYVSFFSEDSQVAWTEAQPPEWTFGTPRLPLELPVRFATGRSAVRLDIVVYYCESARKQLCLMNQLQVVMPVAVNPDVSSNTLRVRIPIPAP